MLSNYDRTMELIEAATNSAGSSQEQFEKTLDSLEAKMNQLSNAWNEFTLGIANSNVIKGFADAATLFLEQINNIISGLSGAGGIAKSLNSAVLLLIATFGGKALLNKLFSDWGPSMVSFGKKFGNSFGTNFKNLFSKKAQEALKSFGKDSKIKLGQLTDTEQLKSFNNLLHNQKNLAKQLTNNFKENLRSINLNDEQIKNLSASFGNLAKTGQLSIGKIRTLLEKAEFQGEDVDAILNNTAINVNKSTIQIQSKLLGIGMALTAISTGISLLSSNFEDLDPTAQSVLDGFTSGLQTAGMVLMTLPPLVQALNISLSTGPLIAITAIATAIVGVVSAINSWNKAQEEIRKETIETANETYKEVEANKELIDSYNDLLEAYKETGEGKEELNEVAQKIIDAYDIEGTQVDLLTGKYENLSKAIQEARRKELEENLLQQKQAVNASKTEAFTTGTFSDFRIENGKYVANDAYASYDYIDSYVNDLGTNILKTISTLGIANIVEGIGFSSGILRDEDIYKQTSETFDFLKTKGYTTDELKNLGIYRNAINLELDSSDLIGSYDKLLKVKNELEVDLNAIDDEDKRKADSRYKTYEYIQNILQSWDTDKIEKYREQLAQMVDSAEELGKVTAEAQVGFDLDEATTKEQFEEYKKAFINAVADLGYGEDWATKIFGDLFKTNVFQIAVEYKEKFEGNKQKGKIDTILDTAAENGTITLITTFGIDYENIEAEKLATLLSSDTTQFDVALQFDESSGFAKLLNALNEEGKFDIETEDLTALLDQVGITAEEWNRYVNEGAASTAQLLQDKTQDSFENLYGENGTYSTTEIKQSTGAQLGVQREQLKLLEEQARYIELSRMTERTSEQENRLNELKSSLGELKIAELNAFSTEQIDELNNRLSLAKNKVDELNRSYQYSDAEAQKLINAGNSLGNLVNITVSQTEALSNGIALVGEGWRVAKENVASFVSLLPELALQGEIIADGSIQLSQAVVENYVNGKETENEADINYSLEQIKRQKTAVKQEIEQAQARVDIADGALQEIANGNFALFNSILNGNQTLIKDEIEGLASRIDSNAEAATEITKIWKQAYDAIQNNEEVEITSNGTAFKDSRIYNNRKGTKTQLEENKQQLKDYFTGLKEQAQSEVDSLNKQLNSLIQWESDLKGASFNLSNAIVGVGKSKETDTSDIDKAIEKWKNDYDWLYNLTEDINEQLRKRNRLESDYADLVYKSGVSAEDYSKSLESQIKAIQRESNLQEEMLLKRTSEMKGTISSNSEFNKYATFNWKDMTIEINWAALNSVTNQDYGEAISEYISKLEEIQDQMDDAYDAIMDCNDSIQDVIDNAKDSYMELEDRLLEALVAQDQRIIDNLSQVNESINTSNSDLIEAIQNSIDRDRQARENEQTERDLFNQENYLAYLRQDTSGANQLAILQKQKELDDARQSYTDQLIDQKISELQEQNEKAANQREKQIAFLEAQLDWNREHGVYWENIRNMLNNITGNQATKDKIAALLKSSENWQSLSELQKKNWQNDLAKSLGNAQTYLAHTSGGTLQSDLTKSMNAIDKAIQNQGKTIMNKISTTSSASSSSSKSNSSNNVSTKKPSSTGQYAQWAGKEKEVALKKQVNTYDETGKKIGLTRAPSEYGYTSYELTGVTKNINGMTYYQTGNRNYLSGKDIYNYGNFRELEPGSNVTLKNNRVPTYKYIDGKWIQSEYDFLYSSSRPVKIETSFYDRKANSWYYGISTYPGPIFYKGGMIKEDQFRFKKGGLADFTGPAWLDGTKSRPEIVLNQSDSQNFIQLRDILSEILNNKSNNSSIKSGDNYFDITINVDELANDYDVDQLTDKIKRKIYEDGAYRNVNTIHLIR